MKAVRLHAYGDVDQFSLDEVPTPVAGPGEVLVKIVASSVNPVDMYIRAGLVQDRMPVQLPAILGLDIAGTVAGVGAGVTDYAMGDRVIAKLDINGKGAAAEYAVATLEQLANLPATVTFEAGATLPLAALTGRQGIDALAIKAGDRVLVGGALGAVGRAAVQYVKQLGGVPVSVVRAERLDEARGLTGEAIAVGAAGAPGFMKAFDAAGGPVAAFVASLVRDGGTLSAVAGMPEGADRHGQVTVKNVFTAANAAMLADVAAAAGNGDLVIPIVATFPLAELGAAHTRASAGRVGGKIILKH